MSKIPPFRFWIAVMIFWSTYITSMMRSNMSVSIIAMVKETRKRNFPCNNITNKMNKNGINFKWSELEQGLILAAYSFGDLAMWPLGEIITNKIGPKNVIIFSSILAATLTGLTPLLAQTGVAAVILCRSFIGLFGSFIYPALNSLIDNWAPPHERDKFSSAMMGTIFGTSFSWPLVGVVSELTTWKWGFYMVSIIASTHILVFIVLVSDSPQKHRWMSNEEKTYIVEKQKTLNKNEKLPIPFKRILSSVPFWAFAIAHFGNIWNLNLILSYAPIFFHSFGYRLIESSSIAAVPFLAKLFCSHLFLIFVDNCCMEVRKLRPHFTVFSHIVPAGFLFLIPLSGCNSKVAAVLIILSQAFNGAVIAGHLINPYDLSPNFMGTLYGITSTLSGIVRITVPILTAFVYDYYHIENSRPSDLIFMIGSAAFGFSGIIFIIFGTGEEQEWNKKKKLSSLASSSQVQNF